MNARRIEPARWPAVRALFERCLDLPPERRAALLDDVARDDAELRHEVEALLDADQSADPTLLRLAQAPDTSDDAPDDDGFHEGQLVGRYRLLRRLGSGGMSVVFLAALEQGELRKQVALKLPRRELVTPDLRRRFGRERRILAALDHPNVARWLDGGEAEDGTPFLVMEHVDGLHLDAFCRRQRLGLRARLRLFTQVCAGVQHAHQNLVVHRDLKPSNVVVGRDGVPKLLDFGIAMLLNPELTSEAAAATSAHLRMMSAAYASPEQLRGEPLGVASDVYSLGVLLFELLTDERPFARTGPSSAEQEAPLPSAVARRRSGLRIERDLDAIVLMALAQAPRQRYPSAFALAADLERYLERRPVQARRAGSLERLAQGARRRPLTTALAGALVLAAALAAWAALRAARAAELAQRERDRAEGVSAFLGELLAHADPTAAGDAVITAPEILESARRRLAAGAGADDPLLEARLRDAVGLVYGRLGRYAEAAAELERAVALRRAHAGPAALAEALSHLAFVRHHQERYDEAAAHNREALELRQAAFGRQHLAVAESLHNWAEVEDARGAPEQAEALFREALAMRRALAGAGSPLVAESLGELGGLLAWLGRADEARVLLEEAVALRRALPESAELGTYLDFLAEARLAQGDAAAAEEHLREAERVQRRLLGEAHSDYADTLFDLGRVRLARDDPVEAEVWLRRARQTWLRAHGAGSRQVAAADEALARALVARGRRADALALLAQALPAQRAAFAAAHPEIVGRTALQRARLLREDGRARAAEPLLREAVRCFGSDAGQSLNLAASLNELGLTLRALARGDEAQDCFRRAYEIYRRDLGETHAWTLKLRARVRP